MSPRPDRRSDSRPERGGRRPAGGPPGRGPSRPGASFRPGGNRRPRWGAPEGEGGAGRGRFPREGGGPSLEEWSPREKGGEGPRRQEGPRFERRRPEGGRPQERFERRGERGWTPERRLSRRPEEGRPPAGRPPRPAGPVRVEGGGAGPRFSPRIGSRPRPPAEVMAFGRGGEARFAAAATGEGEHFAAAAPSDLIWGRHAAQAALESGRPIHRIWCTPEMRFSPRFLQLLREAKAGGVLVEEVTWARLGQISGGAVHQGIVLQPAAAETLDLPSLIEGCRATGESPLLIAVDGLTDPQNLGAIVRSAEALGAHGLVLPQRRNAGLTGSVAKVAAGALEHLPVARVVNLNRSLETLRQEGYRVIGLASEGTLTLEEADLEGPLVVVTGSEADGLSLLTRRHCDQLVRIPLRGTTPSLNASVATALLLYEIARRGWMQGLRGTSPAPRIVRPSLPSPAPAAEPPEPPPLAPPAAAEGPLPSPAALPGDAGQLETPGPVAAPGPADLGGTAFLPVPPAGGQNGAANHGAAVSDAAGHGAAVGVTAGRPVATSVEPAPLTALNGAEGSPDSNSSGPSHPAERGETQDRAGQTGADAHSCAVKGFGGDAAGQPCGLGPIGQEPAAAEPLPTAAGTAAPGEGEEPTVGAASLGGGLQDPWASDPLPPALSPGEAIPAPAAEAGSTEAGDPAALELGLAVAEASLHFERDIRL